MIELAIVEIWDMYCVFRASARCKTFLPSVHKPCFFPVSRNRRV